MSFWRRKRREAELDEELRSHLEMAARERAEQGEDVKDAARAARREFGDGGLVKEGTRDVWGWIWLRDVAEDARYGMRVLLKNPGLAIFVILSLALGLRTTKAVVSGVYGV